MRCEGEQYIACSLNSCPVRRNPAGYLVFDSRCRRCVWWLIPVQRVTKFTMHAIAAVTDKKPKSNKRLPENFLVQNPLCDGSATQVHIRLWRWVASNSVVSLEIVVVVAASATKRERNGKSRPSSSRSTDALLVVKAHWRHVGHHHREQRSDVHSGFHCRGDAE